MTYYHPLWPPPSPEELAAGREAAAARVVASAPAPSARRGYIDAIAAFYADADTASTTARARAPTATRWRRSPQRFPEDAEARIFLALALLGTAPATDTSLAQQRRAGEILNAELARQPQHPGIVHYLIHSFDYPEPRRAGAAGGARLRRDRAGVAARAAHAVAHLHAAGPVAGVDPLQPRLGSVGQRDRGEEADGRGSVRRPPRPRLSRVRLPADRADRRGEEGDGAGAARRGGGSAVRRRLRGRRDPGALRARAAGVEGRGRARSRRRRRCPGTASPTRSR